SEKLGMHSTMGVFMALPALIIPLVPFVDFGVECVVSMQSCHKKSEIWVWGSFAALTPILRVRTHVSPDVVYFIAWGYNRNQLLITLVEDARFR
mgnify:CR=1